MGCPGTLEGVRTPGMVVVERSRTAPYRYGQRVAGFGDPCSEVHDRTSRPNDGPPPGWTRQIGTSDVVPLPQNIGTERTGHLPGIAGHGMWGWLDLP